ncbi:DUF6233 domain-containing protein [Streptomyces sp. NPDC001389]|uniref:DUF6233 domain-containing protein n=1 Tax=Streptomyces sp. NPDC001389 TaxID=3364569 RepID=UPI00369881C5
MEPASTARLDLLRFLERVQLQDLQRTRDWTATEEQLIAAQAERRPAPPPPDWLIEHGIGTGRPPVRVHTGGCWDTRTRCKPATLDAAAGADRERARVPVVPPGHRTGHARLNTTPQGGDTHTPRARHETVCGMPCSVLLSLITPATTAGSAAATSPTGPCSV